jgi:4-amino-4-deoxy-L-arabinose transferase-like glycosyltransferase
VTRPRWERPALLALLAATAGLYLWGLGASGWANAYYSAAAQAGSSSWKAFFYASTDSASAITIDKPPLALWLMSLSVKVFGLSSWSVLVPEALCGVASVGVLYATVRRWFRAEAALLAGAAMALTPVAALMFRFNNPDALLVLLLVGAAYALVRAVETASTRWAVLVGVLVGLGFMTKMLQALLVVPAFALVYLLAAPTGWWRRVRQLLAAGVALAVSSLAWVAIVMAVPASSRPYIGGSQDNSLWNLIFGYNGFGRLTGDETGSVGGGPTGSSGRWGATGLARMFGDRFGGQISWLLPAALLVLVAGLVWTAKRPRTDRTRAALLMWGGWLVVTGVAFSLGEGIIHEYYSVALAPPIAALVGAGAVELWHRREHWVARCLLAAAVLGTSGWAAVLLDRTDGWMPWVRTGVVTAGLGAALGLVVPAVHLPDGLRRAVAGAALAAGLGGPLAFTMSTVAAAHEGSLPMAGPTVGHIGGAIGPLFRSLGFPGQLGARPFGGAPPTARAAGGGAGGGTPGGLLAASEPSSDLTELLVEDADEYTWVAATIGANSAAGYQLATQEPVMAIGGFNGTDPSPTLAQFQQYVRDGRIHWFLGSGLGGFGGGRFGGPDRAASTSSQIAAWVRSTFESRTVGTLTLYDLTSPIS